MRSHRNRKGAKVGFTGETRRSNLRGIPSPKGERVRRTWIPATSLVNSTLHGGIPEAAIDGLNGFLVPERNHEMLANSLSKLAQNSDRWKEMGAAASRTVAAEFAQPRQVEALESAYFEAIEQWRTLRKKSFSCSG